MTQPGTIKHCETCKYRAGDSKAAYFEAFQCVCPKLYEDGNWPEEEERYASDHFVYEYNEGGAFYVGPKFGCVHHAEKE